MINAWYEQCVKEKEDRTVIKLRDRNGGFLKSVIVPTIMYPLNSSRFKVFKYENTEIVSDEKVLELIDTVSYKIGRCYENAENVTKVLCENGYHAESYVGWLFTGETQFPVHHSWTVINGNEVIDLADDFTVRFSEHNIENWKDKSLSEARELIVSFAMAGRKQKNSVRCQPLGKPFPTFYYIGSVCEPNNGRSLYQELIDEFPEHECQRNVGKAGLNPTQTILKDYGLIE